MPPKADLGQLQGLEAAAAGSSESAMIDGGAWDGAKAYKDSKVCNMLTMGEMHRYATTPCTTRLQLSMPKTFHASCPIGACNGLLCVSA